MKPLRVCLVNHHTPYVTLLARALPEHELYVLPSAHAPSGWREDQRPRPANVTVTAYVPDADARDAVFIAQTPGNLGLLPELPRRTPCLYLSHNRYEFEGANGLAPWLAERGIRLVCISERKAQSWHEAGYTRPITVIPPGIPLEGYEPWSGAGEYVLTVANHLRRPLFDLEAWLTWTQPEPVHRIKLVGEGNDGIRGTVGRAPSWDALREGYRHARVYLNPTWPPYEDTWNLAALEAAAAGCPVRNLHGAAPRIADFPFTAFRERWRTVLEEVAR